MGNSWKMCIFHMFCGFVIGCSLISNIGYCAEARKLKSKCELNLPRTQFCEMIYMVRENHDDSKD